jgi:hypothetical protein
MQPGTSLRPNFTGPWKLSPICRLISPSPQSHSHYLYFIDQPPGIFWLPGSGSQLEIIPTPADSSSSLFSDTIPKLTLHVCGTCVSINSPGILHVLPVCLLLCLRSSLHTAYTWWQHYLNVLQTSSILIWERYIFFAVWCSYLLWLKCQPNLWVPLCTSDQPPSPSLKRRIPSAKHCKWGAASDLWWFQFDEPLLQSLIASRCRSNWSLSAADEGYRDKSVNSWSSRTQYAVILLIP